MTYLSNNFTRKFGLEVPIVQGPMGGVSGPQLVAAVVNSGALGILPIWADSIEEAKSAIETTKALTDKPFGVNLRADLTQLDHIKMATDAGVSIIHLFWGVPANSMPAVTAADACMIATVGDREAAKAALDAGASALIAQGVEAGGHVLGTIPTSELLNSILDVAGKIPVIAAGGCANGEDAKRHMDSGASGVLFGTRFVASMESEAHDEYKQAIIEAGENATARSLCFDILWPDAPHRTLVNTTFTAWDKVGKPPVGERPGESDIVLRTADGQEIQRYSAIPPKQGMTGDIRAAAMYAGTGVGRISDCPSVAQIVEQVRAVLTS
jgi:nitronate monooxygenase